MTKRVRKKFSVKEILSGIHAGDKLMLSKGITLIESQKPDDQVASEELLNQLSPSENSIRIGITGVPGVGKSTFIEAFALHAISEEKKVAVLSVDPSSSSSKGSILGDKTRMTHLSQHDQAYVRPSPTAGASGGVATKTREAILLCEAAGYDLVIVETVGVGQAETAVKGMVDFFLVLMLAGAGDELQGIKRGIMELADLIAINKADGENYQNAMTAKKSISNALHYFPPLPSGWMVPVATCSALNQTGIQETWNHLKQYDRRARKNGFFVHNRQNQNIQWMREMIDQRLKSDFYNSSERQKKITELSEKVGNGSMAVRTAVQQLFET